VADELQDEIRRIAEKIPGCYYVSLVGYDGISVAQHVVDAHFDVNTFDAEISSIMLTSREVKENLTLGDERELIWITEDAFFIVQPVGALYFVYACLKAAGSNPGAARIALNKARQNIARYIYQET
jgi:predicted regulator of Ras-like GTPase activity (Roadblock/LC7/MglB family)